MLDKLLDRVYVIEPKEFHWPISALYSWGAFVMEPGYHYIAAKMALPQGINTLLDIGGGDGRFAVNLAQQYPGISRIVTADISKDMAKRAQKRAIKHGLDSRVISEVNDVHSLSYEDSYFDAVISVASMHHWRDPVKAICELDRVLKPGGTFTVVDGCGRPSFNTVRSVVSQFGGSILTSIVYWMGTRDVLTHTEIVRIVNDSEIGYITISTDDVIVVIGWVKKSN